MPRFRTRKAAAGSVAKAIEFVQRLPHTCGGNLLLADRSGARTIIEIVDRSQLDGYLQPEDDGASFMFRSDHFLSQKLSRSLSENPGATHIAIRSQC